MKTLDHVETLFRCAQAQEKSSGIKPSTSRWRTNESEKVKSGWQRDICRIRNDINYTYADDGDPVVLAMRSRKGPLVCCYRWDPKKVVDDNFRVIKDDISMEQCDENHLSATTTISSIASPADSNESGSKACLYRSTNWVPVDWSACKGCFVFIHGISESCRFSLLRLQNVHKLLDMSELKSLTKEQTEMINNLTETQPEIASVEEFEGGWADSLTRSGFVVYGIDLQGHGLSQSWRGSRCNVERIEDFVNDVIDFLSCCRVSGEIPETVPTFLSGLSMGGCVLARTCQIGFPSGRLGIFGKEDDKMKPTLAGIVFFCPAVSAERLKTKFPNNVLVRFAELLSKVMPTVRAARLAKLEQYLFLSKIVEADPLCFDGPLPIRISAESIREMDNVQMNVHMMPRELPTLLIQSQYDTMTDPEGSKSFMNRLDCIDKETIFLDYSWHFLSKEPGYKFTIEEAINWMSKRCHLPSSS